MGRQKIPLEEKNCPGCGEPNPKIASYCNACQSAAQSIRFNSYNHYNDITHTLRKEVMAFVERIKKQRGFITTVDYFYIVHYYQLTHKMILKYDHYTPERQVLYFFIDLLIWNYKQKGKNMTFNKMSKPDIYKTLMNNYAS